MRKAWLIPMLFGFVGALAWAGTPARALDDQMPAAAQSIQTTPQNHAYRLAKHERSHRRKRLADATGPAPAQQTQAVPTQPDIAAQQRPAMPPMIPPPVEAILRAATGQNPAVPAPPPPSPPPEAAPASGAEPQRTAAAEAKPAPAHEAPLPAHIEAKPKPPAPLPREVLQFCASTASAAVDARVAWEASRLTELEAKLRQRIAEFEAKRAEYEDWLRKRDEAMKQVTEDVVSIYSRMRPDAAAAQLSVMDDVMAASLLAKLNSRVASAILAEMDPGRAARIANAMVGPVSAAGGKKS